MALKLSTIFGGSGAAVAGTAGAVSVVIATAVGFNIWNAPDPQDSPDPEAAQVELLPAVPDTTQDQAGVVEAEETPETETMEDPRVAEVPRFDLVRVEADGNAVIAGNTSPLAQVTLLLDELPVAEAEANGDGQFVALLVLDPSEDPRVLSLLAVLDGGNPVAGVETVIIAPFGRVEDAPAALATAAPQPETEVTLPGVSTLSSSDPQVAPQTDGSVQFEETAALQDPDTAAAPPLVDTTPEPATVPDSPAAQDTAAAQAPTVLIASEDGLRVLQSSGAAPDAQTDVQLDAISYDLAGEVTLTGRGPAASGLRVLLNNQPIQLGEVGPGGDWSLALPDVDPGTYTLSVEQVAADGSVTARVDTPFLREDPDRIAASPMLVEPGASVITVQPGFTLWGIAQANFGDGVLYVSIFEENRDQIRNPDMIFPGQIFAMPDLPRATPGE